MKREEILTKLCYYDLRNPNGVIDDISSEEIQEEGYTDKAKENCSCYACFYGRTKLAEELLKYVIE